MFKAVTVARDQCFDHGKIKRIFYHVNCFIQARMIRHIFSWYDEQFNWSCFIWKFLTKSYHFGWIIQHLLKWTDNGVIFLIELIILLDVTSTYFSKPRLYLLKQRWEKGEKQLFPSPPRRLRWEKNSQEPHSRLFFFHPRYFFKNWNFKDQFFQLSIFFEQLRFPWRKKFSFFEKI